MSRSIIRAGILLVVLLAALAGSPANALPARVGPVSSAAVPLRFEHFSYITRDRTRFHSQALRSYAALASEPCLTYTYGVNGRTYSGTMAYSWAEEVGWCYNGSRVTYASVSYRPKTSAGWSYGGIDSKSEQYAADQSFFQVRSVAKFGYGCILPNGGGCAFDRYPAVNIVVRGDGTYSGSGDADARYL
ncbi:MAG: hypothetical protein OHK0022_02740 [Roseiflexaceae bacterium]